MPKQPIIRAFFDEPTNTVSYLVADPATKKAAIIDPVLDYDHNAGTVDTRSVEAMLKAANEAGYSSRVGAGDPCSRRPSLRRALYQGQNRRQDWHRRAHQRRSADFPALSSMRLISRPMAATSIICSRTASASISGTLDAEVLYTPGHTPADISYKIEDAVFVGDTLFMPDYGTARADFPGGDAHQLYRSIKRLQALPPETRLFMCHDYKAPGRDQYAWETTVKEQREKNVHVKEGVTEEEFVAMRSKRDATLAAPRLLLPSIQVNIRAGKFPAQRSQRRALSRNSGDL